MLSVTAQGQTKKEVKNDLIVIDSKEKAEKHKVDNQKWEIELVELNDTDSDIPKKLTKLKKGQSKRIKVNREKYHYKLIEKAQESEFRASYIYLNGSELSKKQIDSLRPLIIEKYKSGVSFGELVEKYNMDGNSKKGDLGWFKTATMVPEFENAVRKHKKGDVFLVNVDSRKWYYVVLKTYTDRINNKLTLIKIKEQ